MRKKQVKPLHDDELREQFAALYEKYEGLMYHEALRVSSNKDLAQDIVQESVCALISRAEVLLGLDVPQQIVYVKRTVSRMAVHKTKKAAREELLPGFDNPENPETYVLNYAVEEAPSLEEIMMKKVEYELLRQAIAQLKEDERTLLTLTYELHMDSKEVAEEMSMSPTAVRMALTRLRRKLRKLYQQLDQ